MANTGNTQQIIDYGAAPNDGTGDPLRTAFIKTDENFDNIWLAGPVGSNITIANNTVQSNNTNGNIILKPNGVGVIQANAAIVPSAANVRDLGTSSLPFRAGYFGVGGLDVNGSVTTVDLTATGDATVGGNLTVEGDVIQIGNIVTDSKTIQLANTATTDAAADGSGVTVGSNDDIATLLYNSTNNEWRTNIGANVSGNVTGTYFIGNGSQLTGIVSSYGNSNVAAYLTTYDGNISAGNISTNGDVAAAAILTAGGVYGQFGAFTGLNGRGIDAIQAGVQGGTFLGTDVIIEITGNSNAYTQFNFQNINTGTQASTDYVITANDGNDTTKFLNIGLTNSGWDGTQDNSLGNLLGPNDGYFYVQDGNLVIGTKEAGNTHVHTWKWDTTGNVTAAGNLIPSANLTYSLGNSTNWWSNIWVASNTIYIGGVPLGMAAGNILTVNGNAVLSNNSSTSISTTGNITADTFFGSGVTAAAANDVVSLNAFDTDGNTVSIQAQGNTAAAVIETYFEGANNRWTWSFDNSGTLTFPASQTSIFGGYDNDFTINTSNTGNAVYTFTFSQFGDLSVPVDLDVSGNVYTDNIVGTGFGNVNITANTQSWLFDNAGVVTLPGNSAINSLANAIRISASTDDLTGIYLVNAGDAEMYANANVSIYADSANSGQGWIFDTTGNLTLPNNGSIIVDNDGVIGPNGDDMVISWDNEELILRSVQGSVELQADNDVSITTRFGAGDFQWIFGNNNELVNITGDSVIVTEAGNLAISGGRDGLSSGNVTVRAVDVGVAVRDWTFDNAGDLTVPNYIYFRDGSFIGDEGGALPPVFRVDAPLGLGIDLTTDSDISGNNYTWSFGINGNLAVPGAIISNNTIIIDNRASGDPYDIQIYSADDILLQARDLTTPGPTEGGDVNINAGDGGPDDNIDGPGGGGDVRLFGGAGGTGNTIIAGTGGVVALTAGDGGEGSATAQSGSGGDLILNAGDGGTPNGGGGNEGGDIYITAGATTNAAASRGSIILTSGGGGDETTNGGYVEINIPAEGTNPGGSWIFTGTGTVLETPNNAEIFNVNAGNLTVGSAGNTIVRTIGAGLTTYDWVFDPTGDLTAPGDISTTGNISGNTAGYAIGYRDIPQVAFTGNTTIATTDAGKHYYSTQSTDYILTIANNASQGFQVGAAISIVNQGTGNITIAQGSGVSLYLAGNATSGNRTLSTFGMATIMKVDTDTWFINGTSIS